MQEGEGSAISRKEDLKDTLPATEAIPDTETGTAEDV